MERDTVSDEKQRDHGGRHASSDGAVRAGRVELVILSTRGKSAQCRPRGSGGLVTLRGVKPMDLVPGEIAEVEPSRQWKYGGHSSLSGDIQSVRLDVAALGLTPLGLEDCGESDSGSPASSAGLSPIHESPSATQCLQKMPSSPSGQVQAERSFSASRHSFE